MKQKTPEWKFRGIAYAKEAPYRLAKIHAKKTPEQHQFSSLIRTLTVGSGISPDQPGHSYEHRGSRTFTAGREFHPAPKIPYICIFKIPQRNLDFKGFFNIPYFCETCIKQQNWCSKCENWCSNGVVKFYDSTHFNRSISRFTRSIST